MYEYENVRKIKRTVIPRPINDIKFDHFPTRVSKVDAAIVKKVRQITSVKSVIHDYAHKRKGTVSIIFTCINTFLLLYYAKKKKNCYTSLLLYFLFFNFKFYLSYFYLSSK